MGGRRREPGPRQAQPGHDGLGKGGDLRPCPGSPRPPLSVRPFSSSWAEGNPHKPALSQRSSGCCRAGPPGLGGGMGWGRVEWGRWGGGADRRAGRKAGLRCSAAPEKASAGRPRLLPPSRCPQPPEPAFQSPPSYSRSPFHPGPGVTAPPTEGGQGEEMGPQSSEEGDGLRAGSGDWAFLGGGPPLLLLILRVSWIPPGPGVGRPSDAGAGAGPGPRGSPRPSGSAKRR